MQRVILLFVVLTIGKLQAQDVAFSQFYELPALRNPALAGIFKGDYHITSAFRTQWASVSVPYTTQAIGGEYRVPYSEESNAYWTLGLQLTLDKAGDLGMQRTQVMPTFAFSFPFSGSRDTYVTVGAMIGQVSNRFDASAARLDDQFQNGAYSPSNMSAQVFDKTSYAYYDFSPGITVSSSIGDNTYYYFGLAAYHFTQPRINYYSANDTTRLARKIVLNAGVSMPLSRNTQLLGYLDYYSQGGNRQLFGGAIVEYLLNPDDDIEDESKNIKLAAGMFYRWNDALIPTLKFQLHKFMLGASYDINVSQLSKASKMRGGFELTLSVLGFTDWENSSKNRARCPRFGSSLGWAMMR